MDSSSDARPTLEKSNSLFVRADKVGLAVWDVEYAKRLCREMSIDTQKAAAAAAEKKKKKNEGEQEWDPIDTSKLEIRGVIAKGTYGTVYRGVYDGQDVAVKVLDWGEDGRAETASLRASFRQEASVCSKLDHPNITKFIGATVCNSSIKLPSKDSPNSKVCCVVVEYLQGGTLKNYLIRNRTKKLPFRTVVQLALDLAKGLSYLHSKKIVHRDVKSENMLLDTPRTVKIADFGVARVEAENPKDMTGETGTLFYMAPEVIDGKPYNRKCDVYSFGICLWEIYCCQMPYGDAISFSELSSGVVYKNLRPSIPKCCPRALASIMSRCWHANPESRPEMDEVVGLLEALDTSKGGGMIPSDQASRFGCFSCFAPRGP